MANRPRVNFPVGSPLDLFGRYGMEAPDPAFDNQYMMYPTNPQLPEEQSSQGYLPPFFPSLPQEDQQGILDDFGWDSVVNAYPVDMDAGAVADAIMSGMPTAQQSDSPSPTPQTGNHSGLKDMLKKAAPYAIALGMQALTSKPPQSKKQDTFRLPDYHPAPIATLNHPGASPVQVSMQYSPAATSSGAFGGQSQFLRGY